MTGSDRTYLQNWIRERDANAFKSLTLKYSGMVYATCLRVTGNQSEAEDLTQECFETLAGVQVVPLSPLGPWLHRVAAHDALDRIKSRKRRAAREREYARNQDTSVEIAWKDVDALVDEAIAALPEQMRVPVVAHFLDDQSYTSIAKELSTTRQTITNRVEKGIKLLRRTLKKRGVSVSASALAGMMSSQMAHAAPVSAATSASLGKIALAGAANSGGGGATLGGIATSVTKVLGGVAMTKSTGAGIGAAVLFLVGVAVYTLERTKEEAVGALSPSADLLPAMSQLQGEVDRLTARNAQLSEELAAAEVRLTEFDASPSVDPTSTLLRHAQDRLAEATAAQALRPETALSTEELVRAIAARWDGATGESSDDLDLFGSAFFDHSDMKMAEAMALLAELSRRPGYGIAELQDHVFSPPPDPDRATEEELAEYEAVTRFAREYLSQVASLEAFDFVLDFQELLPEGESAGLDSIQNHVRYLDPSLAASYAPRIKDYIDQELLTGRYGYAAIPMVAAEMAFTHERREFLPYLFDERVRDTNVNGALQIANDVHTRDAQRFVQYVSETLRSGKLRDHAIELLNAW